MIALIRKDLYTQKLSTYFLTILWFIIFTNFFTDGQPARHVLLLTIVAYFIAISSTNTTFEKESVLINSLPITRKQFILAKYAAGFMWFALAAAAVLFYIFLFDTFAPFPARMMTVPELLIALGSFFILLAIFYPLLLKAGYILASTLTVLAPFAAMISLTMVKNIMENPRMKTEQEFFQFLLQLFTEKQWSIAFLFLLVSAFLTWLSILLSIRIVRKLDFTHK
ncbi:ABC-2 transporter permease [Sporosarcina cascadiensis]|uniref:ABC-2 transporter permease n=1 Tax=Sporosarcina cascadiensis TaxID=2660747 RepID=UPI0018919182|nr:ABC-2 transporter permease [Sporosarcina cascadiensis]